ncbi:cysteine-rich receptor-like protein kinase 25 [Macadamia integrifolia]|uniref:cysteine-rich receptor-like protein kinase 25 n=1 Tax=Macadamia integrifolia TaxID=60698 RepID=UPI001C4F9072|nr:cysteine-rich receptor-like protein kinase 25 [Macadamia integrifolia]
MIRYSNESIFSILQQDPVIYPYGPKNITNLKQYNKIVGDLMHGLVKQAVSGSTTPKYYAAGDVIYYTSFDTVYGLVQCTPDITSDECNSCLTGSINIDIPNKLYPRQGGRVLKPSCNLRYEFNSAFYQTTLAALPPTTNSTVTGEDEIQGTFLEGQSMEAITPQSRRPSPLGVEVGLPSQNNTLSNLESNSNLEVILEMDWMEVDRVVSSIDQIGSDPFELAHGFEVEPSHRRIVDSALAADAAMAPPQQGTTLAIDGVDKVDRQVLFWNIRGMKKTSSRDSLRRFVSEHMPDNICIVEPMMDSSKFPKLFFNKLGFEYDFIHNVRVNKEPSLWGGTVAISVMHAKCLKADRRSLWLDLVSGPLSGHERRVLGRFCKGAAMEFGAMVDSTSMIQVPTFGRKFTWSNNRKRGYVAAVFDMSFINSDWLSIFTDCIQQVMLRAASDHAPILLDHAEFTSMVENAWNMETISSSPIHTLALKLKKLKPVILTWSRSAFPNLDLEVKTSKDDLEGIQRRIEEEAMFDLLFDLEADVKNRYSKALEIHEKMWTEKSRVRWLKEGDRNSSFFHMVSLGPSSGSSSLLSKKMFVGRSSVSSLQIYKLCLDEDDQNESLQVNFDTIKAATNDFSDENKIGEGGFGAVYKGMLLDGQMIAVKRLSKNSGQGEIEFKNEVQLVAKLQHRNLVRILGFCLKGEEKLLIYEFVPNNSLNHFIFDPIKRSQLDWTQRYKIIEGIARGLLYLHEDSRLKIIHRDLKASNVLLDGEMNAKIADFGMARLFVADQTQSNTNRIVGTYGYMAPEYIMQGQVSVKTDVFSFGILLLEIVSGQRNNNVDQSWSTECGLLDYAWRKWTEGAASSLIDPNLGENYDRSEVNRCIHIGLLCAQANASNRPTMATVVQKLNSYSESLPLPSAAAFVMGSEIQFGEFSTDGSRVTKSDQSETKSINEMSITDFSGR